MSGKHRHCKIINFGELRIQKRAKLITCSVVARHSFDD